MGDIIAWLLLGLIAGALAKFIYPGNQGGGIFSTIGLGIFGALVGGKLGTILLGSNSAAASASAGALTIGSIIFAVLGAMLLIFLWGLLVRK
ncbi:MAG: GlsB/YeaQ/YmgE family stress response membrane protein [Calothrix sp. C42_A2020_038]|nr:GlsB/YeaQ/YmgE family stress response membrane protein [Calothrix sp. C42_A2020_038]